MGGRTKVTTCMTAAVITDGTPIKRNGGTGKPHSKERKPEGANFAQIIQAELEKTLHKKSSKCKKHRTNDLESDSDFDKFHEGTGRNHWGITYL